MTARPGRSQSGEEDNDALRTNRDEAIQFGQVLLPVDDVERAVVFYSTVFGLPTKVVDGQRYAALDVDGSTLALVGRGEDITDGQMSASFKVPEVRPAIDAYVAAGGSIVVPVTQGPHELRAVVSDPWGNTLVIYVPR